MAEDQVSRHPEGETAQGECHRGLRETVEDERPVAQQAKIVAQICAFSFRTNAAARARVGLEETKQAKKNAGDGHHVKGPAPSELMIDHTTEHITQRASDRDRTAKNRHDPAPHSEREVIGQNRRCRRTVTAFTDSDKNSREEQRHESSRETRCRRREAPKNYADANDDPSRKAIGQKTEDGR